MPIPMEPMDFIALDVFHYPSTSHDGEKNDKMLLCVCRLSCYLIAVPIPKPHHDDEDEGLTGKRAAPLIMDRWVDRFGDTGEICFDSGPQFVSQYFRPVPAAGLDAQASPTASPATADTSIGWRCPQATHQPGAEAHAGRAAADADRPSTGTGGQEIEQVADAPPVATPGYRSANPPIAPASRNPQPWTNASTPTLPRRGSTHRPTVPGSGSSARLGVDLQRDRQTLCWKIAIRSTTCLVGRHQRNGKAENCGKQLSRASAKALTLTEGSHCLEVLPAVVQTWHETTGASGYTPNEIIFGTHNRTQRPSLAEPRAVAKDTLHFFQRREQLHALACRGMIHVQQTVAHKYNNRRRMSPNFSKGDRVWVRRQRKNLGHTTCPYWYGPYEVVAKKGSDLSFIQVDQRRLVDVHVDRLMQTLNSP